MADADLSPMIEHPMRIDEGVAALSDGRATSLRRPASVSSRLAASDGSEAAQDSSIAKINLRLDRIERRLDLREEA